MTSIAKPKHSQPTAHDLATAMDDLKEINDSVNYEAPTPQQQSPNYLWTYNHVQGLREKLETIQRQGWLRAAITAPAEPDWQTMEAYNWFWHVAAQFCSRLESRATWQEYPVPDQLVHKFGTRFITFRPYTSHERETTVYVTRNIQGK